MERASQEASEQGGAVVHLVGKLSDVTFGFVGPTTTALAECGIDQTVILVTDPPHSHLLPRFHPTVRLELTPAGTGFLRQLWLSLNTLRQASATRSVHAIHLHGFVPCLIALYAVWFCGVPPRLLILSQGARAAWVVRSARVMLMWAVWPFSRTAQQAALAAPDSDRPAARSAPIQLVDHPIDACFFSVDRFEARRPLIVTSSRKADPVGAALFAQLAVLLGEEAMQLSFNWIGPTDEESVARLKAANAGIFAPDSEVDRASKLSAGWIYIAHPGQAGFPVLLIEAMAAGVPCIAWNTPEHRALLRHGETGFLVGNDAEALASVAQLIDSPELRAQMSALARAEARRRFHPDRFKDFALEAYSLSAPAPAPA
jgi:glycosyltransferase involved in cell wall biosynthesis